MTDGAETTGSRAGAPTEITGIRAREAHPTT